MMTPIHTDLMKYSTPTAPTEHERQALRARRQARRAAFSTFIETVFSHAPQPKGSGVAAFDYAGNRTVCRSFEGGDVPPWQ
ncbi:hypothetical protein CLV76_13429, partial [Marivita geojedonensis]|uniref:hypothetical protein n=1 Tax=Marivita geojedonensis TaxID=1123756 RepID=UPI000D49BCE7